MLRAFINLNPEWTHSADGRDFAVGEASSYKPDLENSEAKAESIVTARGAIIQTELSQYQEISRSLVQDWLIEQQSLSIDPCVHWLHISDHSRYTQGADRGSQKGMT